MNHHSFYQKYFSLKLDKMNVEFKRKSEAIDSLKALGYTTQFELDSDSIKVAGREMEFNLEEFKVDHQYKFEAFENGGDASALYAIEIPKENLKGTLTLSYGKHIQLVSPQMSKKLNYNPEDSIAI